MRLGGPVFGEFEGPDEWIAALEKLGYRAAYCPLDTKAGQGTIAAYEEAAMEAGIVIAEVGVWNNPIHPEEKQRRAAVTHAAECLALADEIGASCCVNCAGTRNAGHWYGPHPLNFTSETFDMIVESVREIIDHVKPKRTFYALEAMGFIPPDSPEAYSDFIKAVDRPRFAAHFDPVNIVNSRERYYNSGKLVKEFLAKVGPHVKSVHVKDVLLTSELTFFLKEVPPGKGGFDHRTLLAEMRRLDPGIPLMLEHLETAEQYVEAAEYVRGVEKSL